MLNLQEHAHRRYNPLTREWVLVSPQRTQRPWLGHVEERPKDQLPEYDSACYLCPGNARAGGVRNPSYASTFVFDNDFPALHPASPHQRLEREGLLVAEGEPGICRVVCFSPRHDLSIPTMEIEGIRQVIEVWIEQYRQLAALSLIHYVQIFENRGAIMGASNPHPHCQIWATASLPDLPAREQEGLQDYSGRHASCLLCDYLALEAAATERLVYENDSFAAVVPFWAVWPFETLVISKRHLAALDQLNDGERDALADLLQRLTRRYDRLFHVAFPYSMGFHQAPTDGLPHNDCHLHAHFYPPLLRSATVRKFLVGFEMLGTPQRDITPEAAARLLADAEG